MVESEKVLEDKLVKQLEGLDYTFVKIDDIDGLKDNLKVQLERLNNRSFSDNEFNKILLFLDTGSIYKRAELLRDKFYLVCDDGSTCWVYFLDDHWCKNKFQVSNQITVFGKYENRYDVTILINGLPLVQIELKRRGVELKQAFNQTKRYQSHSYEGLFNYIQIFIISNGVDTRYYANNQNLNFKYTFCWKRVDNSNINDLKEFVNVFLDRFHIHKMISKYVVLSKSTRELTILRAYQYYAVEAILEKALHSKENGYIWHTTGSGKTLTSFMVSQLLKKESSIDKVLFIVDRRDLDNQTLEEFNKFGNGCVDSTDNTYKLVRQLKSLGDKLIITTIQKLSNAVHKSASELSKLKDNKMVLIFDECHRSQFGNMHKDITSFFTNTQCFGFTGTPILTVNSRNNRTTQDIFGKRLHQYLIKDAIFDENVLGFSVEYIGKYKNKTRYDIDVEEIDIKEVMNSEKRLNKIVDYIIQNHNKKTYNKEFTSIFAVSSIEVLNKYYNLFKQKEHDLKIAAIYTFESNPDLIGDEIQPRDLLEKEIEDFNQMFKTNHSTDNFSMYYQDISKKSKEKKIDILLVVNMFLTGFDNKNLNTLYVDKNLEYHGLLQAYSRTNRILNEKKSYGNIVCFRNLKKQTDEAIKLFSDENALETVLMRSYKEYITVFNKKVINLNNISFEDLDNPDKIEEQKKFIEIFRELMRILNKLKTFTEFTFYDLDISEQKFEDYKSKYLDIHERCENPIEKTSILDDLDFEMELLRRDDINVQYVLNLLKDLDPKAQSFEEDKKFILETMKKDKELRSKKELIDKFINTTLIEKQDTDETEEIFNNYIKEEKNKEIKTLIKTEDLKETETNDLINEYEFSGKIKGDQIRKTFNKDLKLKERRTKKKKIAEKIRKLIDKFMW